MRSFDALYEMAAKRKGGGDALEKELPKIKSRAALRKIGDDRWLAEMTKRVFQAGFNWRVIENKWDGFETAFEGFEPRRWKMMSDEDIDRLTGDKRIVRNPQKILSVAGNAAFLCDLADEHGSAARFFADWPEDDMVGLFEIMKKRGSRLGGSTAQFTLRFMNRDTFMLSRDVTAALIREGVVTKAPTSKRDLAAVQDAFNGWRAESGRPLAHISRVLAFSVG